jgi:hypothetical protein
VTLFGHTELVARADSDAYSRHVDLIGHDLANFANIQGRFWFSAEHHERCLGARGRLDLIGILANQNYNLGVFSPLAMHRTLECLFPGYNASPWWPIFFEFKGGYPITSARATTRSDPSEPGPVVEGVIAALPGDPQNFQRRRR